MIHFAESPSRDDITDLDYTFARLERAGYEYLAAWDSRGICAVSLVVESRGQAVGEVRRRFPNAALREAAAKPDMTRLHLAGSALERAVWRALADIPEGSTATYSEVAAAAGYPRAVRAVASAIGRNPIGYFLPCHRVVRKDGSTGGFYWGVDVKRRLLESEGAAHR